MWFRSNDDGRITFVSGLLQRRKCGVIVVEAVKKFIFPSPVHAQERFVIAVAGLVVNLEFRWYWNDGGWKIFDVSANGASALLFYRGYFSALIRRYGPEAALR